ncbi:pre-peptidase C-terminal domain-containing protein, partial [Candidatus Sumerlaeota bacterium]|nr:pre-peptidase C-terminal domain-containing protein [Candidatus Sumerlaeota bacterium]
MPNKYESYKLGLRTGQRLFVPIALILIISSSSFATAPALGVILPRGAQRGTEVELRFIGDRLGDAQEVYFTRSGVEVVKFNEVKDNEVKVQVKIAPDCPLGPRAAYIRTASGISGVNLFTVGALKEVQEPEPNSDKTKAPKVELNTTINGVIDGEDVDYYAFDVQAGQRINAEVEGLRVASSPLDPAMSLYGPDGIEIKSVDDTPLLGEDCQLGYTAKDAGTYTIGIHEASYGGGGNFYYRLHVGTFPRPYGVFPPGGKPGESVDVHWLEEPQLADGKTTMPMQTGTQGLEPEVGGLVPPSPVPVRVSNLDHFNEIEPDNSADTGTTITVPGAFCGVISESKDLDYCRFAAKKGQVFDFNLYGRRIRSPLDSVLYVTNAAGGILAGDDDAAKVDSYFRFTIPDDGIYCAFVKDHLDNGSPMHFYRLEITPVEPALDLVAYIPGRQDLQSMSIPVGNRNAMMLSVRRKDLGGAMKLLTENLPPGISVEMTDAADGVSEIPILLTADAATTTSGRLVDFQGKPADENVKAAGHINQNVELVRIQNNIPIMIHNQKEMPMAVTQPIPFKIEIIEPKVPIVKNGVMNLMVKATRAEGFANPIDLRFLWNPPGVSTGTARMEGNETTKTLAVNAAYNAPTADWKIAVIGGSTVGNGGVEVSSQLAKLSVADPWLGMAFDKVRTDQGTKVEMTVKCTTNHGFTGEATAQLLGLPNKVTTEVQKLTSGTAEIKYLIDVPA